MGRAGKMVVVLAVLAFLAGCGPSLRLTPIPKEGEMQYVETREIVKSPDKGTVCFLFDTFAGNLAGWYVYDNGKVVGASYENAYQCILTSPGLHTFWGDCDKHNYATFNVDAGKIHYVIGKEVRENNAVVVNVNGANLYQVSEEVAIPIMAKQKQCVFKGRK